MRITCALKDTQIKNLYAHAYARMYKSLENNQPFDPVRYMTEVFEMIAKAQDEATAAKFVQQLPSLIGTASFTTELSKLKLTSDIRSLVADFKNEEDGIINTIKYFRPAVSQDVIKMLVDNEKKDAEEIVLEDPEDLRPGSINLKPYSIFNSTFQEFLAENPKLINEFTPAVVDQSKTRIYNALEKIKTENSPGTTLLDEVKYKGETLKLKAVKLTSVPRAKLDDFTNALITRSNTLVKQGKNQPNVRQADEMILLVITNKQGKYLYFDQEGNLTDETSGKLVYQFLRDVRLEGAQYVATNMYGYKSNIATPQDIAKKEGITVEEAKKQQQEDMEQVYKLANDVRKGKTFSLEMVGINEGLSEIFLEKSLTFDRLKQMPIGTDSTFSGIQPVKTDNPNFDPGRAVITLNGKEFEIDKAPIDTSERGLARKIAAVLTSPKHTLEEKDTFVKQFLSNTLSGAVRRHKIIYDPGKKILLFTYSPYTQNEKTAGAKGNDVTIELHNLTEANRETTANTIFEVLSKASSNKDNTSYYPTKVIFNGQNLDTKIYFDYDFDTDEFIYEQSYIEFVKNLKARVVITQEIDPGFFNSYIQFKIPTKFSDEVTKAKEDVSVADTRSYVRKMKDALVTYLQGINDAVPVKVTYSTMGVFTNPITKEKQPYAYFNFSSDIIPGFQGTSVKVYMDPELRTDESKLPKIGDTIFLLPEELGIEYPVVVAYNTDGNPIGQVQETDYASNETPRTKPEIAAETKTEEAQIDQEEGINPTDTEDPGDPLSGSISGLFERNAELPNNVTKEQVDAAKAWWEASPLSGIIELEHVANIVNSNVYARFIVAGKNLTDAKIQVNAGKGGNMVDVYHESWHVFSQLFLTKDQKIKLYNELKKSNPKYKDYSFLQLEEILAEDFRTYALKEKTKKEMPVRNSLFRKILNFIKKLLGLTTQKDILFQNLYFAGQNPKLLNDYTPLVDNVMFDILNRGPQSIASKKQVLNNQDGMKLVSAMDSLISEITDKLHSERKLEAEKTNAVSEVSKAGTLKTLTNEQNKKVAYDLIKKSFEYKLSTYRKKLGSITDKPFDQFKTIEDLADNAAASFMGATKPVYIFLSSQVDSFDSITIDTKNGDRVKGQTYLGVDIIGDFYAHNTINNSDKTPVEILVVNTPEEALLQYREYQKNPETTVSDFKLNERPELKPLNAEQQDLLNKIRILQTAVNNFGDENRGLVKYHLANSRYDIIRAEDIEVDDTLDEDKGPESSARVLKQNIGKESSYEMAGKETRYILASLHKVGKDGKFELDEFGYKKLADSRTVWQRTLGSIGGIKDPEKQIEILAKESELFPEFKQLIQNKLPDPYNAKDAYEFAATTGFFQDFGRLTKLSILQHTAFEDGSIKVVEASVDVNVTIRDFVSRFKADMDSDYITRNDKNEAVLLINKVVADFKDAKKDVLDTKRSLQFARAIGIYLDDTTLIKGELTKSQDQIKYYGLTYIYNILSKLARKELEPGTDTQVKSYIINFKKDPITSLIEGIPAGITSTVLDTQRTQIKRLAELQVKYGLSGANNAALTPEGNTIYPHVKDFSTSMVVDALNNAGKLSDLWNSDEYGYLSYFKPSMNPFTNRLRTMKTLFDFTSAEQLKRKDRSLELFLDSGFQIIDQIGTSTTSLDIYGKFLQEFHGMLKAGVQEFIRAASKSSSFGTRIEGGIIDPTGKRKKDPNLWIDIDRFGEGTGEKYAIDVHMMEYLAGEYDRIRKFKANRDIAKMYQGYNRVVGGTKENPIYAGETFIIFHGILNTDTKKEILTKVGDMDLIEYLKTDTELRETIYKEIVSYFNTQTEENLKFLEEANYISPELINKVTLFTEDRSEQEKLLMKAYTYNSWIQNFETVMIFLGDPAQSNHKKEETHKRNTMAQSNGPGFRTDKGAKNFMNGPQVRGTSYGMSLPGKYGLNYNGTFNTAILQDISRDSVYYTIIKEALIKDYTEKLKDTDMPDKQATIEKLASDEAGKYLKMEEGDGQGWITFDAYRALKIAENAWDWVHQERLFQKIVKGEQVEPKDCIVLFPPYKVQNYGHLANETILPVMAGHKFELGVLIPSMIKNSDLEKLHMQMMEKNVQYVTFQTGSKIGSVTSVLDKDGKAVADQVYADDEQKSILPDIKFTINKIYLQYLKKVTNMPSKFKGTTIFPTQLRVLAFDALYNQGELANATPEAKAATEFYKATVDGFTEIVKEELYFELGVEEQPNGELKVDLTKFMSLVQRELERKDMPEHLVKFIGVNPDGTLRTDLSFHPNADDIEKMMTNMIEKRLVKQKVKGEAFIQLASSMTNGLWDSELRVLADTSEKALKLLGSNNLPFYYPKADGTTAAMKVAIALHGDFENLLNAEYKGERIATIERLNQAIKDDEWLDANEGRNRKAVTMTGVRIPTDSKSQMDFMEVYHFLDPAASNVIILPAEMVAKSGTDYDGDKLTNSTPHISKKGNFIQRKWTTAEVMSKVAELKSKGKKKEAKAIIALHKKVLENELILAVKGILELKDNYVDLVRPNTTSTLEGIADEIQEFTSDFDRFKRSNDEPRNGEITPTSIFEVGYNLHKHQVNLDAARPLGVTAVENKLGPLFNSIGAKLPATYKFAAYDDDAKQWVETDREYTMRNYLPHNVMIEINPETGERKVHISLSNLNTVDGLHSISVLNSQLLNGFLDVEKKPWAFYIGGNEVTTPMLLSLFKMGVPPRTAIYFITQPMVREYVKQQKLIKSPVAPLIGTDVSSPAFTQWEAAVRTLNKFGYNKAKSLITNEAYYNAMSRTVENNNALDDSGFFNFKKMEAVLKFPDDPKNKPMMITMFLHYLEMEKQLRGWTAFKMQFNPDTVLNKTLQEIVRREVAFEDLDSSSKIDKETKRRAREESLLTSFFVGKEIIELVKPQFRFRNHDKVTDFIVEALRTRRGQITDNYGAGKDGVAMFITDFKNALTQSLYQNSVGELYDPNGKGIDFARMVSASPDGFNSLMIRMINRLPVELKNKYPILNQFTVITPKRSSFTVLTLNDRKYVKGDLAEIYYQNLKELSNVNIQKLSNPEQNQFLSQMFELVSLVSVYQNGTGFSTFGIPSAVPYDAVVGYMQNYANEYIEKYFTEENFAKIMDTIAPARVNVYDEDGNVVESYKPPKPKFRNLKFSDVNPIEVKPVEPVLGPISIDNIPDETAYPEPPTDQDIDTGEVVAKKTFGTPKQPSASTENNPADYTNHSGGAYGGDTFWDIIGREFGVTRHMHYREEGNKSLSKQLRDKGVQASVLTKEQMEQARGEVKRLLGKEYPDTTEGNLQVRNYYQVANSDAVYAIAEVVQVVDQDQPKNLTDTTKSVKSYKHIVKGGTNTAVQLGIKLGKPVYVWDLNTQQWTKWDGRWFTPTETPVLTKNFAGVGSRDIESYSTKDKEGNWVPRPQYKGKAVEEAAKQAIRDVYDKTFAASAAQSTEAPVSNTNKPKGEEVVPGIYVNQAALTKEEQLELFDYLKPYLEEQAAKTLKASNASKMIGLGLRWDYKSNNVGRTAVTISDVINPGNKNKYGYYDVSINDQPLGQISPRFRELMQKATGVDMTNYDGAIINLYEKDTFISSHNDVDESRSAIKYPVIGINLGGKGNFSIERIPGAGQLNLEAGTGYIFGVDGVNREVWHRTFPTPQNTFLPELTTKIDGKTYPAGSYRITITMRRVMPLEPGMPTAPAKLSTTQPSVQTIGEVKEGVQDLFNSNTELVSIGTPEEYSEWINYLTTEGKLAGTQATEILYHGTDKEFTTFDKTKRGSATGEGYFKDEEQTPIDSMNAFFFSSDKSVSEQYGLLRRIEEVSRLTNILSDLVFDLSSYAGDVRKISPALADHLKEKQKELTPEEFKKYIEKLRDKYYAINKQLGTGFLNKYNNYTVLGKQLQDLKNKKAQILSGTYVHNSFSSEYPELDISFYKEGWISDSIDEKGYIREGQFKGKNITSLTSKEFDKLISNGETSYNKGMSEINSLLSKAKITPILYRVLLNVQRPLVKDFEGITFVNQAYDAGAQYEASKLTNQAAKSKGQYDSVIFKNIRDPYMSDNYGVFEPEQVYILGGIEDIEGFRNFVQTRLSKGVNYGPTEERVKLISDEDISRFKAYMEKSKGMKPKEFFTSDTRFSIFYNPEAGRRETAPQYTKWLLNAEGYYDLIDQITGEMYIADVDLETGEKVTKIDPNKPVNNSQRDAFIKSLKDGIEEYRLDEVLAVKGYDIQEIISNLEAAKTQQELDNIINKVLKNIC